MSSHASSFLNIRAVFALPVLIAGLLPFHSCVTRSRSLNTTTETTVNDQQRGGSSQTGIQQRINVNTASAIELETLPGIGRALAERIIEHREKFGGFRRPEHLIIVRGISDKRFRALRDLITVE
jgi:competence ComEA-like helix-hairpin-helix protein